MGIKPEFKTWDGKDSLVEFVVSMNLHRRHLNSSQRATIAAEIEPVLAEEAKERQREAGRLYGERHPKDARSGTPDRAILEAGDKHSKGALKPTSPVGKPANQEVEQKIAQPLETGDQKSRELQARDQAAMLVGTNRQYVSDAKRIRKEAPEVFEKVKQGKLSISEAKRKIDRKTKPAVQREKPVERKNQAPKMHEHSHALFFASIAISQLERINSKDPKRTEALEHVESWIGKNK